MDFNNLNWNYQAVPSYDFQYQFYDTGQSPYFSQPYTVQNNQPVFYVDHPVIVSQTQPIKVQDNAKATLIKLLTKIAEEIFSDEGLQNNPYLLRQIIKSNGWVSTKFICSIKSLKRTSKNDSSLVIEAITASNKLVLSDDKGKTKRIKPISEELKNSLKNKSELRTIVAINIPDVFSNIEGIQDIFGRYGPISQLRLIKNGESIPDFLKGYATQVPELGRQTCAIVEYEKDESAKQAQLNMSINRNRSLPVSLTNMRVAQLGPKMRRNLYSNGSNLSASSSCRSSILSDQETTDSGISRHLKSPPANR